jgi:hypothetical protein
MSDSTRLAVTLGLNRTAGFAPVEAAAPYILNRGPADALRALASNRILLEAASPLLQLAAGTLAPEETRPLARQTASTLLQIIFATESWLALEALELLDARGLRLPHAALAAVLPTTDATLRSAIANVAGVRGSWLAKTLNDYLWLLQVAPEPDAARLQQIFEEGVLPEREAALRAWRDIDQGAARAALQTAFAQDKADVRVRLLACLAVKLSADDAPWLESLDTDRAASVQAAARELLLSLPDSAMRARNRQLLANALRVDAHGLHLDVPESWPIALAADGLTAPANAGTGARAFTIRVLASVTEPLDWLALSTLDGPRFVAALLGFDYFIEVMDGWLARADAKPFARPAVLGELAETLLAALLVQARSPAFAARDYPHKNQHRGVRAELLKRLNTDAWRRLWPDLSRDPDMQYFAFHSLPKPWPAPIAESWLATISARITDPTDRQSMDVRLGSVTLRTTIEFELDEARVGLAPAQFAAALALKVSPEHDCFDLVQQFQRELELRARIYSEFYP